MRTDRFADHIHVVAQALDHTAERTSQRDLMGEYNDRPTEQLLKHFLFSEKHVSICSSVVSYFF